jgi:hypothetical protein
MGEKCVVCDRAITNLRTALMVRINCVSDELMPSHAPLSTSEDGGFSYVGSDCAKRVKVLWNKGRFPTLEDLRSGKQRRRRR